MARGVLDTLEQFVWEQPFHPATHDAHFAALVVGLEEARRFDRAVAESTTPDSAQTARECPSDQIRADKPLLERADHQLVT